MTMMGLVFSFMDSNHHQIQNVLVIAYWWVTSTDVQADANMSIEYKDVKGVSIPCLVNHKEIPPFTKLCKFMKKKTSDEGYKYC